MYKSLLLPIFCFLFMHAMAQKKAVPKKTSVLPLTEIEAIVAKDSLKMIDVFKDLHTNPELGFMETRTASIVAAHLKSLGFDVKEGIGKTGVVGILHNGRGPMVMYRADMDCNAVQETTGLPYASKKIVQRADGTQTPVMHACGHDAHTTWLMGVASVMSQLKNKWSGTLIMVAQPAEEPILGAEAMVNDGMYTTHGVPQPDYLFGMHTAPIPIGVVVAGKGVRMAGTDQIDVYFKGIGGHGSAPQVTKDPVVMAAAAVMQYQVIVSRAIDPQKAAVLTVGSIQAGSDNNVIPSSALVKINLRWFDEKDRKLMIDGIQRINEGIAHAYNLPDSMMPTMVKKGWSYPLVNSDTLTRWVVSGLSAVIPAAQILGEDKFGAVMGSEDFHHLVVHNPIKNYCYLNVGTANPATFAAAIKEGKQVPFSAHNGDYVVDTNAIPFGIRAASTALVNVFNQNNSK
ncbi:MAG: amidohydrolase [Chitinophagaceae bacterium]